MRRVLVENIPVNAWVSGWVEIPDDTTEDGLNDAIAAAIVESGYEIEGPRPNISTELDEATIQGGWAFDVSEK